MSSKVYALNSGEKKKGKLFSRLVLGPKSLSEWIIFITILLIAFALVAVIAIPLGLALGGVIGPSMTTTVSPTGIVCTPFWRMPSSDQGTNLSYTNANSLIVGDFSRSGCVTFRANTVNANSIIFSIGSSLGTNSGGCNQQWAISIMDAGHITVYGMCGSYDNNNIFVGQSIMYDGSFHQLCVTYDNTIALLCLYLDLQLPQCITRTNVAYNTGLGVVRIGWWPDGNFWFSSSGGGLVRSLSLFNLAINQSCVTYQYQMNNLG